MTDARAERAEAWRAWCSTCLDSDDKSVAQDWALPLRDGRHNQVVTSQYLPSRPDRRAKLPPPLGTFAQRPPKTVLPSRNQLSNRHFFVFHSSFFRVYSTITGKFRDPCQLVWQVKQLGGLSGRWFLFDPCQLVWQVKEFGGLRVPLQPPKLLHLPDKLAGVEVAKLPFSSSNCCPCQTSWQGQSL
jgi:hypothetical protein